MKYIPPALILLNLGLFFTSCDEPATDPPVQDSSMVTIEKSAKRGIAFDLTLAKDLTTLQAGVSWWYNWYMETEVPVSRQDSAQMIFLPMLWGGNPGDTDLEQARETILANPAIEYLLVLNEPNLTDQANLTPDAAAIAWLGYEQFLDDLASEGRDLLLVGPALNWGTLPGYEDPLVWMDTFMESFRAMAGRDPRLDHLAFHWYDYGLASQLDRLQKYGRPIWVTEMANWNPQIDSYHAQAFQMQEMVTICEQREDVFRYAWFIGRGPLPDEHFTYLFGPDAGTLTDLGELYISLPFTAKGD